MSLSEERMMILKMLQEGKITSDEAAKLLEALDSGRKQSYAGPGAAGAGRKYQQPGRNYYDELAKAREKIREFRRELSKNYNQKDFDKMVDDFCTKAEKVGKDVATATFGIVDKLVDFVGSFVDTGAFKIFGNCVLVEKTYEAEAVEGQNLLLQATNGQITVKKHPENKILVKAKIRTPQDNAEKAIVFANEDDTVSLKLANPDTYNLSVAYEVYIPGIKFGKILLESKNGKIYVEDTLSSEFSAITKNAAIDLTGITGDKVSANTKNARIAANYLIGSDIKLSTKNASVDIKNLKAGNLCALSVNGKIALENLQAADDNSDISLFLQTKNADIKTNMNDSDHWGYKVKACTTNGDINLLIPNLLYRDIPKIDGSSRDVEAETENYGTAAQKVNIVAETQNGYIEIIK